MANALPLCSRRLDFAMEVEKIISHAVMTSAIQVKNNVKRKQRPRGGPTLSDSLKLPVPGSGMWSGRLKKEETISVETLVPGVPLAGPIEKEFHTRGTFAYLVMIREGEHTTLILAQKLKAIVFIINDRFSQCVQDRVTVRGLYEATYTYTTGVHKCRYHIQKCSLSTAHRSFESLRREYDANTAIVVHTVF